MIELNNVVLQEFAKRGLSINEGIAVDARLVKSASKPLSNDDLRELKDKRSTPEGQVDEASWGSGARWKLAMLAAIRLWKEIRYPKFGDNFCQILSPKG